MPQKNISTAFHTQLLQVSYVTSRKAWPSRQKTKSGAVIPLVFCFVFVFKIPQHDGQRSKFFIRVACISIHYMPFSAISQSLGEGKMAQNLPSGAFFFFSLLQTGAAGRSDLRADCHNPWAGGQNCTMPV